MRYGGRDAQSESTYLDMRSLKVALEQGLELHAKKEQLDFPPRPKPFYPQEIPALRIRTSGGNQGCVECHLVDDYRTQAKEADGTLDRIRDLYRSPDIKRIGIYLDVPKGLVVKEAKGPVLASGMRAGDTITHLEKRRVYTFGDLQYAYDKVPRDQAQLDLTVDRAGKETNFAVKLPDLWWFNYHNHRRWTVEPKTYFKTTPLTLEEKKKLGLEPDGFASRVSYIEFYTEFAKPEWKLGDVIYGVEGVYTDPVANFAELHIKLRHRAGDTVTVEMIRDGKKFTSELVTERENYRK